MVLTVEEPTGPSSFRVHGSATLGGFVFVVWPCAGGLGFGGGGWLTHPCHRHHLCPGAPHQRPAPPVWPPGGWHPPLPAWHPPLSGEQLASDGQRLRVPPGRAAQVRPCLAPTGHSGVPGSGTGTGTPPAVPSSHGCRVPRQGEEAIRCTTPTAGGLGSARVALWIDGEEFLAPLPFQYRPDPFVSAIDPSCSYE